MDLNRNEGPFSASSPALSSVSQLGGKSALELFKAEMEQASITTMSTEIDKILGGGVPLGFPPSFIPPFYLHRENY